MAITDNSRISPHFAFSLRQTRAEMCTSETTICYGVVIRSWQLIVAAHAFIKFSPLLRGIDTVILRQRNGTLRVEGEDVGGGKNVGDMPVEVLELIRSKVFCEKELEIEGCELVAGEDDESEGWRRIPLPHRGLNPGGCGCWDNHDQALNEIDLSSIRLLLVSRQCACRIGLTNESAFIRTRFWSITDSRSFRMSWRIREVG